MRCFETLGISELATEEEINSAFQAKNTALLESKDVLGVAAYEKKYKEICNARTECTSWRSKSFHERTLARVKDATTAGKSSDVRLNATCFGPCTCTDMCCGSACDGSAVDTSCCENSTGSQTCPIVCDVIFWAPGVIYVGFHIIRFLYETISDAVRNHARNREQRIQARIVELRSQLSATEQRRASLEQQLNPESEKLTFLTAFTTVFSEMGVSNTSVITIEQDNKVKDLRNRILECHDKERSLRAEIAQNEQLIFGR